MLKIGVLGAGFMGSTHARSFARLQDAKVVAVSSRSAARASALAKEVGAEPTTDAMALVRDPRIDALSITLPTPQHAEYAIAALEAGKHVLLEKPMALTVEECDAIVAAWRSSGKVLLVAHVLRFWPEYVAMAEFLKSGAFGKPLSATARRMCEQPEWGEWLMHPAQTGGGVLDLHIHDLDALNWLFGAPKTVTSLGQRGKFGGWDQALTLVDYGDVKGFAEGSAIQPKGYPFTATLWVLCEKGSVEFTLRMGGSQVDARESGINTLTLYEAGMPSRPLPAAAGDAYDHQTAYFAECVSLGRQPTRGTPEQARLAVQTSLAARRSIETGQTVSL